MKCEYCGNVVDQNLKVCPHCGADLPKIVVVKKVVAQPTNSNQPKEVKNNKINYFLYGVIGIGILLIILLLFLRYGLN